MIRIVASKAPYSKLYEVSCRLYCDGFTRPIPSTFLLDSGSDKTTVIAERFGLNIKSLPGSSVVLTATGRIHPALLRNVIIIFGVQNGRLHAEELDSVDVISLAEEAGFHGVLGMDVLDRFKWRKTGNLWGS